MKYLAITHPDIENDPGCRVTLWILGCSRKCPGCHIPCTHDYDQGIDFLFPTTCFSGNFYYICPV